MAPSPSRTASRKKSPVTRLPINRPCWSGNTMSTVSMSPALIRPWMVSVSSLPRSIGPLPSDRLQVALDGRHLFGGPLDLRSLEPLAGGEQIPAPGQDDDRAHRDRRVVQRVDRLDLQAPRAEL